MPAGSRHSRTFLGTFRLCGPGRPFPQSPGLSGRDAVWAPGAPKPLEALPEDRLSWELCLTGRQDA